MGLETRRKKKNWNKSTHLACLQTPSAVDGRSLLHNTRCCSSNSAVVRLIQAVLVPLSCEELQRFTELPWHLCTARNLYESSLFPQKPTFKLSILTVSWEPVAPLQSLQQGAPNMSREEMEDHTYILSSSRDCEIHLALVTQWTLPHWWGLINRLALEGFNIVSMHSVWSLCKTFSLKSELWRPICTLVQCGNTDRY